MAKIQRYTNDHQTSRLQTAISQEVHDGIKLLAIKLHVRLSDITEYALQQLLKEFEGGMEN